ncbi:hypothetical protein VTI74DRAFT_7073 [Chaetomium olivicolor]
MGSSVVGSVAWTNGNEYVDEYSERISQFVDSIDLDALPSYAVGLRNHRPCFLSREFSAGSSNLRKIEFDDVVAWIARLWMPPMPGQDPPSEERIRLEIASELATMECIRQEADIPIPKVYGYDSDHQNTGPPLIETNSGPYDIAAVVYFDYPVELGRRLGKKQVSGQKELLDAFRSLAVSFQNTEVSKNGFGPVSLDLSPNNVLVDRKFKVDTHLAVVKRQKLGWRFAEVVDRLGFFPKEAVAFRSLVYVKSRQDFVNKTWVHGLKWLSEHSEEAVLDVYLQGTSSKSQLK